MLTNPPCDPLPRARGAHPLRGADGRARREQLLRHLHVTVLRSRVQRRESGLPGARAVSARPAPRAPAPLDEPSMRARPPLVSDDPSPPPPKEKTERLKQSRP